MRSFYFTTLLLFLVSFVAEAQQITKTTRTLIVIFDGLRPDYITAQNMPHVFAFREKGSYGLAHHSVFPTVTRVNASSYATGSYPATHGLLGNTVYFPELDKMQGLNTGDVKELMRIKDIQNGKLLTAVSLGEVLQQSGHRMMVFSSGSSGQAFLQNHTVGGGGVVHPEVILPSALAENVISAIGAAPSSAEPNAAQHDWVTRALLRFGLVEDGPLFNAIWFSDPDATAHSKGIGNPLAMESIRIVDQQFGKIMQHLQETNLEKEFNIIITADHGFATDAGTITLNDFLVKEGLKKAGPSDDVVLAGNAIYVKDHNAAVIRKIVSSLQAQPWIGAIFTKALQDGSTKGSVDGTLSFESIHWHHPLRAGDILVDYNWDARKNSYGYEGTSFAKGVAGHGGASPYEIHIPLIASGPDFKKKYRSTVPTSNIDIVPSILHLLDIPVPPGMDGRVMTELFSDVNTPAPAQEKEILETTAQFEWGTYSIFVERSIVGKHHYVNFARVARSTIRKK